MNVQVPQHPSHPPLDLQAGELVEVRSLDEIFATLDKRGRLEGLPFMPEMAHQCGRQFRVYKRSEKNCDRIHGKGLIRTMPGTVHLEAVRCDGAAHGGCEAGCLIFWKEAWLKRVTADGQTTSAPRAAASTKATFTTAALQAATQRPEGAAGETRYVCQATEQLDFSVPLPSQGLAHYWRDIRYGNFTPLHVLRTIVIEAFNNFQQKREGVMYPRVYGTLSTTPSATLGLKAGDLVQVRTKQEILDTLNVRERNRGLSFDREMVQFCGGTYKVLRRVKNIIEEKSGRMLTMKGDCIILDGAVCAGDYNKLCPRSIYPYWREIWLQPATPGQAARPQREESFTAFLRSLALNAVVKAFGRLWSKPAPEAVAP